MFADVREHGTTDGTTLHLLLDATDHQPRPLEGLRKLTWLSHLRGYVSGVVLDAELDREIRSCIAEALEQSGVSPRPRRRGRPPKAERSDEAPTADRTEDGGPLLDQNAAMRHLGVGRTTLYVLVREGKLNARYLGRRKLFQRRDLESFVSMLPDRMSA